MRKITRIGLGVATLGSLVVGTGVTPAAAVGCYGYSCNGKGPSAMGCDADAFTATNKRISTITVELRHSWACGASWVRITGGPNDSATVTNSPDGLQMSKKLGSGGGSDWSAMVVNSTNMKARACGKDILNNEPDATGCTNWW